MFARGLGLLGLFLLFAAPAQAATLYIDTTTDRLSRGDAEVFQIRLDTDEAAGECVNTVSSVLTFTGPIEPIDVSTGGSIFSMWVEPPTISQDKTTVSFTGGIPNGYCGRVDGDPRLTNVLFEVIARTDVTPSTTGRDEDVTLAFVDAQTTILLNDGFGTPAPVRTLPAKLTVSPSASTLVSDPWTRRIAADTIAPQEFSIQLEKDRRAFGGRYYISFNTTDKETGIDHYEVMEEPLSQSGSFAWGRGDAPWVESRSPYVLEDQSLNSTIRVRAIDKAGNDYVAVLVPDTSLRTLSAGAVLQYVLFATLVIAAAVVSWVLSRRYSRRRSERELADYDQLTKDDQA